MSKIKNRIIHSQGRQIIANVLEFCEKEAKNENLIVPLFEAVERTSAMTGLSKRSVCRIRNEKRKYDEKDEPLKSNKHSNTHSVTELDDFNICIIRRTINQFHLTNKSFPTIKTILQKLKEEDIFNGSAIRLRKIVKRLGYKWTKCKSNCRILKEKNTIISWRIRYIRSIRQYREEGRPIVFMDETSLNSSHAVNKTWQYKVEAGPSIDENPLLIPEIKDSSLFICHAGGKMGFIENSLLMYKASQKSGDCHDEMNWINFEIYVKHKLIPNMPNNSVLVIDNTPYYNVLSEKCPTSNSRKLDMEEWLRKNKIAFTSNMLKDELYNLIKLHKPLHKKYKLDDLLKSYGISVLRLPPYHADLNPVELIWRQIKQYVASNSVTYNLEDVKELFIKKLSEIGIAEWEECCERVIYIEDEYMNNQPIIDDNIENLIIQYSGESSETSEDDYSFDESE